MHAYISGFSERHKILFSTATNQPIAKKQWKKFSLLIGLLSAGKKKQKFKSMEFRTPSVLATPLNLVRVKVDFWGIFRLSFKSNLGSGTVLGPNSLFYCHKWHAHHRLSQPYSKLNPFTSWSHFPAFPVVFFFFFFASSDWLLWIPLILFCETSEQSKSMFSLCFSDTLMLEPIILPDCGHTFCKTCISRVQQNPTTSHCPLCKKPIWSSTQLKTNFTLKKLVEKIEVKCTACIERGNIEVVARHTCPDALISCSNRGC